MKVYHILNGDSLKNQFPTEEIDGEIIVTRECLIDGPVNGDTLQEFLENRAEFIKSAYGDSNDKYNQEVISEIRKMTSIEEGEVNLWFEDDLFCQVNFWFVCSLLYTKKKITVNLVRPSNSLQYGFGGLTKEELIDAHHQRMLLTQVNVNQFTWLWFTYRKGHIERLLKLAVQLSTDFPFIKEAIIAQIERHPLDEKLGRPEQTILDIIKEKSTQDFNTVFQEFGNRAPIYGFGDLQFKRIFDQTVQSL